MAGTTDNNGAAAAAAPKVTVNYGVYIPEMGKTFTKAELEADQDAIDYLVEIQSEAVTLIEE